MKNQDYINLINSEYGTLQINKYCSLHRWTDSFGEKVDKLKIVISITSYADYQAEIISRSVEGIKSEIKGHIKLAFEQASDTLCNYVDNNYSL